MYWRHAGVRCSYAHESFVPWQHAITMQVVASLVLQTVTVQPHCGPRCCCQPAHEGWSRTWRRPGAWKQGRQRRHSPHEVEQPQYKPHGPGQVINRCLTQRIAADVGAGALGVVGEPRQFGFETGQAISVPMHNACLVVHTGCSGNHPDCSSSGYHRHPHTRRRSRRTRWRPPRRWPRPG